MKLYHTPGSPPSRAVLMTIRNLGLEVDIEEIDLAKNEQNKPEFLKLNPAHQVPVLVDNDFVVTESRSIQAYLVNSRKPGSALYPSNAKTRAIVDSRLYFDATSVFPVLRASLGPMFFSGATEVSAENRDKLKQALKCLNGFLEGGKYLAGDEPTIADISTVSNIIQAKAAFGDIGIYPNLDAWFKRCEQLPGFEENVNGAKCVQDFMKLKGFKLAPFE